MGHFSLSGSHSDDRVESVTVDGLPRFAMRLRGGHPHIAGDPNWDKIWGGIPEF